MKCNILYGAQNIFQIIFGGHYNRLGGWGKTANPGGLIKYAHLPALSRYPLSGPTDAGDSQIPAEVNT
jgi:hypothetical protein